jgi:anaerobic dimethyl sulfoxide reductase subunit B (iron-sulfur subunit)
MAKQYGFLVNIGRCVQCEACVAACKTTHHLDLGQRWRKVITYWSGNFPTVSNKSFTIACQHCENPPVWRLAASPHFRSATRTGSWLQTKIPVPIARLCADACPYGAIQFAKDDTLQKCDFCLSRLDEGLTPSCVATCPTDALQFGTTEELARIKGAQLVEGDLGPNLYVVPPAQGWDIVAFQTALSKAKQPSEPSALTVIL